MGYRVDTQAKKPQRDVEPTAALRIWCRASDRLRGRSLSHGLDGYGRQNTDSYSFKEAIPRKSGLGPTPGRTSHSLTHPNPAAS